MVLFIDGRKELLFKDIGHTIWLFVLALMEGGYHIIIAIPVNKENYHEDIIDLLEKVRPDLEVRYAKGGGVLTVTPASYSGALRTSLRFCRSLNFKEADWSIVERVFREAFPEARVYHLPKCR